MHPPKEPLAEADSPSVVLRLDNPLPVPKDLRQPLPRIEHPDAREQVLVRQGRRLGDVDEEMEMVAHDAVRQNLHAGKARDAPKPVDKARALLFREEERAVGATVLPEVTGLTLLPTLLPAFLE